MGHKRQDMGHKRLAIEAGEDPVNIRLSTFSSVSTQSNSIKTTKTETIRRSK